MYTTMCTIHFSICKEHPDYLNKWARIGLYSVFIPNTAQMKLFFSITQHKAIGLTFVEYLLKSTSSIWNACLPNTCISLVDIYIVCQDVCSNIPFAISYWITQAHCSLVNYVSCEFEVLAENKKGKRTCACGWELMRYVRYILPCSWCAGGL